MNWCLTQIPLSAARESRGNIPHPSGQRHEQRGVSRCQLLASVGPSGILKSPCQGEGSHRSRCWAAERSDWFQRLQFLVVGTFLILLVGGWRWLGGLCCPPLAASSSRFGRVVTGLWLQAGLVGSNCLLMKIYGEADRH